MMPSLLQAPPAHALLLSSGAVLAVLGHHGPELPWQVLQLRAVPVAEPAWCNESCDYPQTEFISV